MSLFKRSRGRRKARKTAVGLLPLLPGFVRMLGGLLLDRRASLADRGLVVGVIAYILLPIDLIPDFLGILGFADDLFLLGLAVRRLVTRTGEDVLASHWPGERSSLERLTSSLDELGTLLPGPVHRALSAYAGRWRE